MKKIVALAVVIIGVLSCTAIGGDFREADWGMTVDEVKATGGSKDAIEGVMDYLETLVYQDTVSGLSCRTKYFFIHDSAQSEFILIRGRYIFKDPVWENDQFYRDYITIKTSVTNKYGVPSEDRVGWTPLTATKPAAQSLDVSYLAKWETPSTQIYLVLEGYQNMWSFFLEFYSKELRSLEDEALDKAAR